MKHSFFLLLFFFVRLAHAFDEEDLKNLHVQVNAGQRVYAVGFNLQGADLRDMNLKGADFTGANLRGANFSHSNLAGALFHRANLSKANFHKAKVKKSDLTDANINGASFKGARLLGIHYHHARSAKGTLFEDKEELLKRITHEERIHTIKEEFIVGEAWSICIDKDLTLKEIHEFLYEELNNLSKDKREYTVLDFRFFNSQNAGLAELEDSTLQEDQSSVAYQCLEFLQKPFFSALVEEVIPICRQQALIVIFKKKGAISAQKRQPHTFLDLHGKVPTDVKFKWVDQFIKKAHRNHADTVEIITGRGLNNPQGIMGLLWNRCYQYLYSKRFEPYIEKISSMSKKGGWRITLKKDRHIKEIKGKKRRKHTVSLYGANAPFKNVKLSVVPALEKKVEPEVIKRKKKSKKLKQPSNSTLSAYTEITAKNCISLEFK